MDKNEEEVKVLGQNLISDDEIEKMAEEFMEIEKSTLLKDKSVFPKIIVASAIKENDKRAIIVAGVAGGEAWNSSESKRELMADFGKKVYSTGFKPGMVFLVSEAWLSVQPNKELNEVTMPSEDPNRKEVLIVNGLSIDGRSILKSCEFEHFGEEIRIKPDDIVKIAHEDGGKAESTLLKHFYMGYVKASSGEAPSGRTKIVRMGDSENLEEGNENETIH